MVVIMIMGSKRLLMVIKFVLMYSDDIRRSFNYFIILECNKSLGKVEF